MKLYKNQRGFSHVQILLVVFVVVIIGAAGWLVFSKRDNKNTPTNTSQTPKQITSFDECVAAGNPTLKSSPAQCEADGKRFTDTKNPGSKPVTLDETASWLLYTPPGNEYSIRLADGWNFTRYEKTTGLATFDNNDTVLKQGTKAVVTEINGGKDGRTGFFFNYATQNIEQIVTPGAKQTSLKTNDGIEIEKYYWIVSGYSSDGGLGPNNGDSEYTYVVRKASNRVVTVFYSFQPGNADNSATIEKALKTLHFN